ncbi:transmembrane protein 242 isoform X3 [Schistocerca serialis cubense]|uniref:transmembrane protein 242 isoform X2 n=1 Tax=Schistocerca serialis cubense TaxID=2023355 RepID=UPI00214E9702|nr:transmembrane protein 242 isoform X2 [Schistocerca serialis cubense]XP_049941788.1 transmembrane protein 242 isoform X3 [Schistocerca serialis cubense]
MTEDKDNKFKAKAAAFLATVGSISALIGFGSTLALVKRKDPANFDKGLEETGVSLAIRALGRGTLYAFAGCGCLFYAIWKLSGANNITTQVQQQSHITTTALFQEHSHGTCLQAMVQ